MRKMLSLTAAVMFAAVVVVAKPAAVLRVGPPTTYLKAGLSAGEVVRFLGKPSAVSERREGGRSLATYVFPRGGGRVLTAEFVDGTLVRSSVASGERVASR